MAFKNNLLLCTPLECETMEEMQASMEKAKAEGADLVELCLDSMSFSHISEVQKLIKQRTLPSIVSFRYVPPHPHPLFFVLFLFSLLSQASACIF
jgi:3-dehydroquinate dehydratase/shikimate dehydrogenase